MSTLMTSPRTNHIEIRLDALPGQRQDELTVAFDAAHNAWAAATEMDAVPPPWPAEAWTALDIAVADDVGTAYLGQFAQAGGEGTPWEMRVDTRPLS